MKDFAMIGVAALLIGSSYALEAPSHPSEETVQTKICNVAVTDTVPRRNDTLNKRMPQDTMSRRDTLQKRDSIQ